MYDFTLAISCCVKIKHSKQIRQVYWCPLVQSCYNFFFTEVSSHSQTSLENTSLVYFFLVGLPIYPKSSYTCVTPYDLMIREKKVLR